MVPYISSSSPLMLDRWIYCNRADTHWYTMDKVTPLDHPKPPKQARFPDAPGRTRTHASKLVAGAGVSGSTPLLGSPFCLQKLQKQNALDVHDGGFVSSTSAVESILGLRPSRRRRAFPCLGSSASSDQGLAGRRSGPQGAERTSGACRRRVVSQCRSDASLTIGEPTWKTLNRETVEALVGQDV